MLDILALVERVGPALLRTVINPPSSVVAGDVVIAEPDRPTNATGGDLVLGVAISDAAQAVRLVRECGDLGTAAVLLKPPLSTHESVVDAARAAGVGLIEVHADTAWAQLVWMIRAALAGGIGRAEESGAGIDDLFRLADAVADVVDAPVTIEDAHSQVLAYSARQDLTDPARISTIMGRKQPDEVLAKFRARGTFRQLTKGSSAIFVPGQQDGTLPRLVMPIRMGGELLGSMWAVVPGPVSEERATTFADTAPLAALHLLRWRAVADVQRQRSAQQLRLLLEGGEGWRTAANELAVPDELHRVIAIEMPDSDEPAEGQRLAMWERITRGIGRRPLVTEIGTVLFALAADRERGGGWPELREAVLAQELTPRPLVAVGTAVTVADIPRSKTQAEELLGMLRSGLVRRPVAVYEHLWHLLALKRMAGAATDAGVGGLGPLTVLREHDRAQGTEYLATLHAWLRHPGDPRRAGRELRVHPNTFRYRMKRINQLIEVDLDDADMRSALLMQLLAERWAQHG